MWFFSFEWGYSKWLKRPTNESAVCLVARLVLRSSIPGKVFRWYCQGVVVCTLHKDYGTFLEEGREGVSVSASVRVGVSVSVSVRVWGSEWGWECVCMTVRGMPWVNMRVGVRRGCECVMAAEWEVNKNKWERSSGQSEVWKWMSCNEAFLPITEVKHASRLSAMHHELKSYCSTKCVRVRICVCVRVALCYCLLIQNNEGANGTTNHIISPHNTSHPLSQDYSMLDTRVAWVTVYF